MVICATAQETIFALRRTIAKLEGTLPERLDAPVGRNELIVRRQGIPERVPLPTGLSRFDAAVGGFPASGLIELLSDGTKDSGTVAGFCMAMACMLYKAASLPLIWIGTSDVFREAGRPYPPGLLHRFGIPPHHVLIAEASRVADMLWIAEEAASLSELAAVIVEIRGNARQLDLTATRRLHRRALIAGYPLILLRHAGRPEPTAAPIRLIVAAAPAAPRSTMLGPLQGSIGPPAFHVTISKSRIAKPAAFTLEWNDDLCTFQERRQPEDHVAVVSPTTGRARDATASWTVVASAFAQGSTAAGLQPARKQHAANRNARHAG